MARLGFLRIHVSKGWIGPIFNRNCLSLDRYLLSGDIDFIIGVII